MIGLEIKVIISKVKVKGKSDCIPWDFLRDYILEHFSEDRAMDVFAIAIYGVIIFLKSIGYVESVVVDLFTKVCKLCNPIPSILTEIIHLLSFFHKKKKGIS